MSQGLGVGLLNGDFRINLAALCHFVQRRHIRGIVLCVLGLTLSIRNSQNNKYLIGGQVLLQSECICADLKHLSATLRERSQHGVTQGFGVKQMCAPLGVVPTLEHPCRIHRYPTLWLGPDCRQLGLCAVEEKQFFNRESF